MADLIQPQLHLPEAAQTRRRGRPPGARNRRSVDLAKWVEATMGGQTPGQQMAQLAMCTPAEVRRAKDDARELQLVDLGLSGLALAMVVKAERLGRALGIERGHAWMLLQKERAELMPYIHQRQPQAADPKAGGAMPVAFLVPEGEAQRALPAFDDDDGEGLELLEVLPPASDEVGQPQSDD